MCNPLIGVFSLRNGTRFDLGSNSFISNLVCSIPAVYGRIPLAYNFLTFVLLLSFKLTKYCEEGALPVSITSLVSGLPFVNVDPNSASDFFLDHSNGSNKCPV